MNCLFWGSLCTFWETAQSHIKTRLFYMALCRALLGYFGVSGGLCFGCFGLPLGSLFCHFEPRRRNTRRGTATYQLLNETWFDIHLHGAHCNQIPTCSRELTRAHVLPKRIVDSPVRTGEDGRKYNHSKHNARIMVPMEIWAGQISTTLSLTVSLPLSPSHFASSSSSTSLSSQ